jgi:hypothetical protein
VTAPAHTDALLELINERADVTTGSLLELVARVRRRLVALAIDPAKLQGPALAGIVSALLAEMGVAAWRTWAGSTPVDKDRVKDELDYRKARLERAARDLATTERPSLAKALLMLGVAGAMASGLRGVLSDGLVGAQTAERRREAQRGSQGRNVLMWVPERDACARCLRYAGLRLLNAKDRFPGGLSYDPDQASTGEGTVVGPPLHPHCRCELQVVAKGASEGASEALQREAERAIMKGWALESESQKSRRRAAAALLEQKTILAPVSVRREAAKRLGERTPFTRPVPSGNETPAEKAFLRSYSGVYKR